MGAATYFHDIVGDLLARTNFDSLIGRNIEVLFARWVLRR